MNIRNNIHIKCYFYNKVVPLTLYTVIGAQSPELRTQAAKGNQDILSTAILSHLILGHI